MLVVYSPGKLYDSKVWFSLVFYQDMRGIDELKNSGLGAVVSGRASLCEPEQILPFGKILAVERIIASELSPQAADVCPTLKRPRRFCADLHRTTV